MEKLWQKLFDAKIYSKSFEEFEQQFSTEEKQQLLYDKLNGAKYYSKSFDDFKGQFFAGKTTDPVKETASAGSEDQAVSGESQSVPGSLDLEKINNIRSNFGYKPINEEEYLKEQNNQITEEEQSAITDYIEELMPGSKYDDVISDEVTNIYNLRLKSLPKTEFGTLDFDDEGITSSFYNSIISDFQNSNPVIQNEILPKISGDIQKKTEAYANKLKTEMGLDDPNNVTQEAIDELKSKASDFYNKNLNAALAKDKDFQAINTAFNNKVEELQGPSYKRFVQGKDSPFILKMKDAAAVSNVLGMQTLANTVENAYNMFRQVGNSLEDAGVRGYLGYQADKEKDLERTQKLVNQYGDDTMEGVWITDKQNLSGSWKFIPKTQYGNENSTAWRTFVAGQDYSEGTFADFKQQFGQASDKESYIGKEYTKIGERLNEIQEQQLVLSQWDEKEFDKIMAGEDVVSNSIALAGEQLPQMALALVTLGASSGAQIGSEIYSQGIDVEARKRFMIPEGESPTIDQLAEILKDDKFMSNLEAKAVGGGFIAGQLERFSAGKTLKAFTTSGVTSILRGGYKNFLKGVANGTIANTQRGATEAITEVLQEVIQAGASGASIDGQQLFKAGGTGFISSAVLGIGGNVATQSASEIKTINKVISGKLNPNSSEAFLNNKLKDLKIAFDNNEISQEAYNESVESIKSVKNANASIPKNFSKPSKEKALDLLIQKQELLSEMEGKDPSMTKVEAAMINDINLELEALTKLEKAIGKRQSLLEAAQKAGVVENLATRSFDTKEQLEAYVKEQGKGKAQAKRSMGQYGTIFQNPKTGRQEILINKEIALEDKVITTADHEFLHAVLYQTVKNNKQAQINLGQALYTELVKQTGGAIKNTQFAQRLNNYLEKAKNPTQQANAWEEALTLFAEGLGDGTFKAEQSFIEKIKQFFKDLFGKEIDKEIRFDEGADVVKFIQDYNKSFEKGKWGEGIKKLAREGAKGKLVEGKPVMTEEEVTKESARSNLDEQLNKKYKGNPKQLIAGMLTFPLNKSEFAQQIGGITNTITKRLYDPIPADQKRTVTREDFIDALISEAATMVDQEYKGLQNLDKFVSNRLNLRANNLASRLGIEESIKADVTEQKGVMAEETAEQTVEVAEKAEVQEKRKAKPFIKALNLEAKVNNTTLGEMLNSALAKNVALGIRQYDAEISSNRTVTPFIQYIKNELAEDLHKDIAKTIDQYPGGYETFLSDYRTTLLYNYTTTYLSKNPLFKKGILKSSGGTMGTDNQGKPIFKPKWVAPTDVSQKAGVKKYDWVDSNGKKLKIDRDNAGQRGLTSGPIIMKRDPNIDKIITEDEFINFHFDDGPTRKRIKVNARLAIARQIASEAGLEIMKEDFQSEGPLFQSFKERADLLGTALAENVAVEIAKDIDRGVVKESARYNHNEQVQSQLEKGIVIANGLINNDTAREIWETAIAKGPQSRGFNSYLKKLDVDKNVLDIFLDTVINDKIYLVERAQKAKGKTLGDKFEVALNELLSRQMGDNFSIKPIKQIKGDLGITIGSESFALEVKLNDQAQIGSTTVRNILTEPQLFKGIDLSPEIVEQINKQKDKFNEFVEFAKNYGAEIDGFGALKLKDKADWETIKKDWGKAVPRISFEMNQEPAMQLYKTRDGVLDVPFIHIGGKGTFATEVTEISAGVPVLQADMEYVVRMVRSGKRVAFRLFPNFKNIKNESQINLETSTGRKRFADIITRNTAKKYDDNVSKALLNSSVKASERKGISVWDFDDTLARTKSNVLYTMPDGSKGKLNAEEFAKKGDDLANAGAEFDFSEFSKVMQGKKGPMFEKAMKRNKKFGNENVFILTARPADSKFAIHEFLKGLGLDIKIENIVGLANGAPQAKADWIMSKVAEGYNDFYFADDAYKNVAAVQDVLAVADVKSDVQQAKVKFSERLSEEFNEIIEDRFGIESYKRFSEVVGRRRGYKKGKWRFFIPPQAEDFQGLLYDMYGKGKRGEAQKEWFDQTLILPYIQGIAKLERAKQKIKRTYADFLKSNKGVGKKLKQKIEDGDFTHDQALRVYLWTQAGFDIPGLSQRDQDKLNAVVQNDEQLIDLSIQLRSLSQQEEGWIKPEEYWDSQTLLSDLSRLTEGVSRQAFLGEFIENVDIVFSKENKNKLRAALGNQWVAAAENAIARMKSGVNHVGGADRITNNWTKWVNNSVGSIMFFNRRSATLQLLSTANFLNWSDNNPLKAAAAFANQPQYWKDWTMIFNSDKLRERRGGLKTDVSESEIANAAEGSKNKVSAIISYLLKKGFLPTQIADSIAIASGGATFYRNRVNTYIKQGMTNTEAEAKAFEDFSRLSDEAQQSSDPMLVSQEQSTTIGRLILAFANTPQQYMRLTKKAARDLINGRGDARTHISKIAYYTFVQNLIFSTLQAAGFALIPGFDDDDEELEDTKVKQEKTAAMIANSMSDTVLRGLGLYGAIASTIKNAAIKYTEEKAKDPFKQDMDKVVYAALNISPPIGSKAAKIKSAMNTEIFERDVMEARGYNIMIDGKFIPNPRYAAIGKYASAIGNIPMDRAYDEISSITEMLDSRNTAWQRVALGMGYKTWQVGADIEEHDLIKVAAKKKRKEEGKKKAAATRKKTAEKKAKEKRDKYKGMSAEEYLAAKAKEREEKNKEK